jgi:hypothetical protein
MMLKKLIATVGLATTLGTAVPALACDDDGAAVVVPPPAPAYGTGYYGAGYYGDYGRPGVYYRDPYWTWRRHEAWERHRDWEWRHRWHRW